MHPHHMTVWEEQVREQLGIYEELIDRGKGEYGRAGYVPDDIWHGWLKVAAVLRTIKRKANEG